MKGQQDWVEVKIEDHILQVQCLIFCHVLEKPVKTIKTMLYNVDEPKTYAIFNFLEYNFLVNLMGEGNHLEISRKFFIKMKNAF